MLELALALTLWSTDITDKYVIHRDVVIKTCCLHLPYSCCYHWCDLDLYFYDDKASLVPDRDVFDTGEQAARSLRESWTRTIEWDHKKLLEPIHLYDKDGYFLRDAK